MRPINVGALTFALFLRELQLGPSSVKELADVTGCTLQTIRGYVRALRKQHCIHVAGHEQDETGRTRGAVYVLGEGKDVPRSARLDNKTRWARRVTKLRLRAVERLAA